MNINEIILQMNKRSGYNMFGIYIKNSKWIDTNEKKDWFEMKVDNKMFIKNKTGKRK